jgi:hypothetical protein
MTIPSTRHAFILILATLALAGCAPHRSYRGDPYESPDLKAFLAFLREPGTSRDTVESRLGSPRTTFEGGRIAAYQLWEEHQETTGNWWDPRTKEYKLTYSTSCDFRPGGGCDRWMIQLLVEYGADQKVLRHNAIMPYRQYLPH